MVITVAEFKSRALLHLPELLRELQAITGRHGQEEATAWSRSLPLVANVLSSDAFAPLHIYFGSRGNLALEYQLPAASSWCDMVLLGRHDDRPAAVVIELKHWMTRADTAGLAEGLITRRGNQELHPSEQVRGYASYCQRFHSAVHETGAVVHGCVVFTADFYTAAYKLKPNEALVREYPIFSLAPEDAREALPIFFSHRLTQPDASFALAFEKGTYRQNRGFVRQIGAQLLDPAQPQFELLDGQRRALALCAFEARRCRDELISGEVQKRVIVVKGPPGSGKSAVAARLWATIVSEQDWPDGNILIATTSMSQNSNWSYLFEGVAEDVAARGLVRKATVFHPLSPNNVGQLRAHHGPNFLAGIGNWRDHLQTLKGAGIPFRSGANDNENLVTIVDEAHALITPTNPGGTGQFGFAVTLGPQGYHVIRASIVSFFFLDPAQSFRARENTSIEEIRGWSRELGAGEPLLITLDGMQFRCAGSPAYVDWVEALLGNNPSEKNRLLAPAWAFGWSSPSADNVIPFPAIAESPHAAEAAAPYGLRASPRLGVFDFQVFDDPASMEVALRQRIAENCTARLLSTESRKWITRGMPAPHDLPPSLQDFQEPYEKGGQRRLWSRPWNVAPDNDYTLFVQAAQGSRMETDSLCEVGCPYTVRGFDFDYVGILWLNDFVWRDDHWVVNPGTVFDSGLQAIVAQAAAQPAALADLRQRVAQTLRILMTRPVRGAYIWASDGETRRHLRESVG